MKLCGEHWYLETDFNAPERGVFINKTLMLGVKIRLYVEPRDVCK